MKLIKKYYVNWSYEIELIFVVYLQGDLFLNHIQQRACRCPLFIPKGPLLHLYTINYLTCYINHVSCITSFWFFSFHVKFLKAFLNWFYIVIDLLSWFKSVYCWIFRHQETFDADTQSMKGVSMDSMGRYVFGNSIYYKPQYLH